MKRGRAEGPKVRGRPSEVTIPRRSICEVMTLRRNEGTFCQSKDFYDSGIEVALRPDGWWGVFRKGDQHRLHIKFLRRLLCILTLYLFGTFVHTHIIPIFRTYERHTPKKLLQNFIKFFIYKVYTMRVCAYILLFDVHTHFHKNFR